jgi:ATP-dependent Clp protease ATP-binding subunit ClpC
VFERFNEPARQVVVHAQISARDLGHNHIGTEHLLLGMFSLPGAAAEQALTTVGLTEDSVRTKLLEFVPGGNEVVTGQIPFTPRAKKVLELSLREALTESSPHIGTEHLLLGLLREGEGVGARIIKKLGVELPALQALTREIATRNSAAAAAAAQASGERASAALAAASASASASAPSAQLSTAAGPSPRVQVAAGFTVTPDADLQRLLMAAGARALAGGRTRITVADLTAALAAGEEASSAGGAEPPAGAPAESDPPGI